MIHGHLISHDDETVIHNVSRTTNFFERMAGLLFLPPLKIDDALLITPCSSVHTFGMRYAIDLVFLDHNWIIVKTVQALKPWRMAASGSASMVIELAANRLNDLKLSTGQQLEWHDES